MTALDASVLIALLWTRDPHHRRSQNLLSEDEFFVVHPINLAEALVAPVRAGRGDEAMRSWRAAGVSEWLRSDGEAIGLARLRVETGLKLPDCCALLAGEVPRSLATFDERLARAARARGIEVLGADR